jgi:Flp pilus assembly protein CpaB
MILRTYACGHRHGHRVDEKPKEVPTVTLLVTPEEAEKLTLAPPVGGSAGAHFSIGRS